MTLLEKYDPPLKSYKLDTGKGRDLDGYVFLNENHARRWMGQRNVRHRALPVVILGWKLEHDMMVAQTRPDFTRSPLYGDAYEGLRS